MNTHSSKAEALFDLKRYTDAYKECKRVLTEHPEDERTLYLAGFCSLLLEDFDDAEHFAKILLSTFPDEPGGSEIMGYIAVERDQDLLAEDMFYEALRRDPEEAHYYAALGSFLGRKNRIEEALALITKGLQFDSEHPQLLRIAAYYYAKSDEPEKAKTFATRALAADPEDSDNHLTHGLILLEQYMPDTARYSLRESIRLNPTQTDELEYIAIEQARSHLFFRHAHFLPTEGGVLLAALATPVFWFLMGYLWSGFSLLAIISFVVLAGWYAYYGLFNLYKRYLLKRIKQGKL